MVYESQFSAVGTLRLCEMKQLITTYSTLMDAQKEGRGEVRGGGGVLSKFKNTVHSE